MNNKNKSHSYLDIFNNLQRNLSPIKEQKEEQKPPSRKHSPSVVQIVTSIRASPTSSVIKSPISNNNNNYVDKNILDFINQYRNNKNLKQKVLIQRGQLNQSPLKQKDLSLQQYQTTQTTQNGIYPYDQQNLAYVCRSIKYPSVKSRFSLISIIEKGNVCGVHLAREKQSGYLVVIKVYNKLKMQKDQQKYIDEWKLHMNINHPNIIKTYGIFDDQDRIYVVQEYACDGDAAKWLKKRSQMINPELQVALIVKDILNALQILHQKGIVYRSLRPSNILLNNVSGLFKKLINKGTAKLSNFRNSTCIKNLDVMFQGCIDYLTPEMILNIQYDCRVDIWQVGILIFELFTGSTPFSEIDDQNEIFETILNFKVIYPLKISLAAKDFLNSLLQKDPQNRIPIKSALNHKWIQSNVNAYKKLGLSNLNKYDFS